MSEEPGASAERLRSLSALRREAVWLESAARAALAQSEALEMEALYRGEVALERAVGLLREFAESVRVEWRAALDRERAMGLAGASPEARRAAELAPVMEALGLDARSRSHVVLAARLTDAGVGSAERLRAMSDAELLEVYGIGPRYLALVRERLG